MTVHHRFTSPRHRGTPAGRTHALLQPCMCGLTPGVLCMACARWHRHYRVVTARVLAGRAGA